MVLRLNDRKNSEVARARRFAYDAEQHGAPKSLPLANSMILANIVITLVVAAGLVYLGWIHPPSDWTAIQSIGAILCAAGFALWTLARFQLGRSLAVTARAKQLVTRGLYSKIRNPIYVFSALTIAGYILVLGKLSWLLILVIVVPMQIWRARVESRVLEAEFGDEYRAYRARTWF